MKLKLSAGQKRNIARLKKLTAKAKKIRRKGESWLDAMARARGTSLSPSKKAASRSRSKKVGTAKKKRKLHQTGSSNLKIDRQIKAKQPGKRTIKHRGGKKHSYYESRKNRSDMPGRLTGAGSAGGAYRYNVLQRLTSNVRQLGEAEKRLSALQSLLKVTPKGVDRTKVKMYIADQKKFIISLKSDIRMLKALLK